MKNAAQPQTLSKEYANDGHAVWLHRRSTDAPARPGRPAATQGYPGAAQGSPWSEDNVLPHPLPDAPKPAAASAFAEACEALRRKQVGESHVEQITLDDTTLPRPAQGTDYTHYWLLGDDGSLCIGSGDEMIRLDPAQTRRLRTMLLGGLCGARPEALRPAESR